MPVCCATRKKTQDGSRSSWRDGSQDPRHEVFELHQRKAIATDRKGFGVYVRSSAAFHVPQLPEQIARNTGVDRSESTGGFWLCWFQSLLQMSREHLRIFLAYRHGPLDVGNHSGSSGKDSDIGQHL